MMRRGMILWSLLLAMMPSLVWADGLGSRMIDEVFDFPLMTGNATNCDSTPTVSVYEGNEAVPTIRNAVLMTQRTAAGRYYYRETLSAVNGYEVGKTYTVVYACTQGSAKEAADEFQVIASTVDVAGLTESDVAAIKTKTDFLPSVTAGAAGGVFIAGTNAATTITTAFTTTFTGNLTGSVGSVTGNVGGDVVGAINLDNATGTLSDAQLDTVGVNTIQLNSSAQSAVDLQDFADAGYDPLTDALTIHTDTSGTTTLLTRLPSAITFTGGNVHANVRAYATGEAPLGTSANLTLDTAEIGIDAINASKVAADTLGASEVAADFFSELLSGIGGIYGTLSVGSTSTNLISAAFVGTDTTDYVGWTAVANNGSAIVQTFNPAADTVTLATTIGTVTTGDTVWLIPTSLWELLSRVRSQQ